MTIYLDHNATTAPDEEVINSMMDVHRTAWGNPSSIYSEGQKARELLEASRKTLADFLGLEKASQVVWTSGGTESNCTALWGAFRYFQHQPEPRRRLIISAGEHPSVIRTAHMMKEEVGIDLVEIPLLPNGLPDLNALEKAINEETFLVSMMFANNETGAIFPIEKIGKLCQDKGVLFHTDAVNALTKAQVDFRQVHFDFMSLSAHKIHGPKGVGALIWKESKIHPIICGGGQERHRRAGTENVPSIVGFAKACEVFVSNSTQFMSHMLSLRKRFEEKIRRDCEPVRVLCEESPRLVNTSTLVFPGVSATSLLIGLDLEGICIASGSACSSGSLNPSHVLLAMGLSRDEAQSAIRVSLGRHTTFDEIDQAASVMAKCVQRLRQKK